MANFRRLFSVTIVISLLLSIGVLFISQLATAGDGEAKPEESTLYEASKSWDGAEPNIDVDQDHLDFACSVGGSTPNMAATLNQLDFECTTSTLSSYETPPSNGKIEIMLIDSPPTPPVNVSRTIVNVGHLTASAVILNDVPTSEWTYGCTATSAGMLFGYYDRTGYPNMYTGSTNGGVCPLTDLGQGIPTNPRYPIPGSCYIISTENGLDGISSNAHVDDYWISYGSAGPDPWEGNWPEHTWGLCTADFLGTNQWKWDYSSYPGTDGNIDSNGDGSTTIWNYNDGSKLYDWCPGPAYGTPTTSCCHGMRLFAESRGYSVEANYNQLTYNQNSNGFTFAEFQAEINAGRPVLIHVIGHTMVGIGYDAATNSIYIHDTWDNTVHSMTWGGSYAGMDMYAVTVIHLAPPEYSLTISSTSGGSVTTPGEGTFGPYDPGDVVNLVATAEPGYHFTGWTGDTGTIANPNAPSTTITMNGDYSITANFALIPTYALTMAVNPPGGGTATDLTNASPYVAGTVVSIQAVAAAGYQFVNWSAPAGTFGNANAAQTTFTMPAQAVTVTANFAPTYALTMAASPPGGGTAADLTNASPYVAGTVVNIQAVAAAGYQFVNWSAPAGTFGSSTAATTTFTMPAQAITVTANFALIPTYALTMAASPPSGGTATDLTNASPYTAGTVVSIEAVAAAGYRFVNWTAPAGTFGSSTAATTTFTMPAQDVTVTANFVALYDLTIDSTVGGNVTTPGEGLFPDYDAGTVVSLNATPDAGYRFDEWTGDVGTIADVNDATTTITMNGDMTVTATFEGIIVFPDPNLEAAIREAIGKPSGDIYQSDLVGLTSLTAEGRGIANLGGLEYCTSLTTLYLRSNQISDISPLSSLTSLSNLKLGGNQISEVSPLGGLTSLTYLTLGTNQISDISPLSSLTSLSHLNLGRNQISDIEPLANNPGLSTGDNVWLGANPLNTASVNVYIPQLEERGVTVYWDTANQVPDQPTNVSPANAATGISLTPTLQSSAFSDPDAGDTHDASQWQLTTTPGDYSSPTFDSGIDATNLTIISIPSATLSYGSTYYWHVRHQDNRGDWSSWSQETSFNTIAPPPTISTVSPNSGVQGETLSSVTITGTYFTGATSVSFGSEITVNNFTVNSATQIMANIFISSGATPGARDVSVTTPGGTATKTGGFTVTQPTPQLMEGDVTLDKCVKASDAMFILQYLVGIRTLDADQLKCADTTDDGEVSAVDAMHILQWLVDSDGSLGVLYKPLWESPKDDDLLEPDPG